MGGAPSLQVERDVAATTIRLRRPDAGNSLSRTAAEELAAAVEGLYADTPACVVIAAEGARFFCAGGDLDDYADLTTEESAHRVSHRMQTILGALRRLPCPVIAAVEGVAVGGGVELALACDLRIVGANASFALTQVRLGVVPGWGGAAWLTEAVGRGRAIELMSSGRTVAATEAVGIGLADLVVPAGTAELQARETARLFSTGAPTALREVKSLVDLGDDPDEVAGRFARLWVGEEHRAAERAWQARRRPAAVPAHGLGFE